MTARSRGAISAVFINGEREQVDVEGRKGGQCVCVYSVRTREGC